MRNLLGPPILACVMWGACGSPAPPQPGETARKAAPAESARPTTRAQEPWTVPFGFRAETIPFPLDFAPAIAHRGEEELRFAPGFLDPAAPGYWSYTFVWRTEDPAMLDAGALAAELTAYFRGLVESVDTAGRITDRDAIVARATPAGTRLALTVRMFDVFKTQQPIELVGWAERRGCETGALWSFVLAPAASTLRPQLDTLVAEASCDQPIPAPAPPPR